MICHIGIKKILQQGSNKKNLSIRNILCTVSVCNNRKDGKFSYKKEVREREGGCIFLPVELRGLRLSSRKTFSTLGVAMCSIAAEIDTN